MKKDRKEILLKVVYKLLKKCEDSRYVLDVLGVEVEGYGDGPIIMEDIAIELGIEE